MLTRIITSVIALILLGAFLIIGGIPLIVFLVFVSAIANFEIRYAMGLRFRLGDILSSVFITFMFFVPADTILSVLVLYVFTELLLTMFIDKYRVDMVKISIFGIVYGVLPFILLSRLINFSAFSNYYLLAFIIPWTTDTFAYFGGMSYRKFFKVHKLYERVSPKKTIEGALGGIVGCVTISLLFKWLFLPKIDIWSMILLSIVGSIASQVGDLTASKIKRYCGIKDFSNILPGHGGVLDRLDSILFTATTVYIFVWGFM